MVQRPDNVQLLRPSPVPLWQQMADSLRKKIGQGELAPGDRLPSETELGHSYGVSRITVRKAIETLLLDELVVRTQGKGTFVAAPVLRHELSGLAGIIDSISGDGIRPRTRLHDFGYAPAPARVAALLSIGAEPVLRFRRIYDLDGAPFGLADVWIPGATTVSAGQADQASAYTILSKYLGVAVARADVVIRAQRADRGILGLLDLPRSASLLHFERTSRCAAGQAREHTSFWVRSERYEFSLGVNGPMPIGAALRPAA